MADSVVTVRDVFELPRPGSPEESSPRWRSLRQWINEDLAAAKSPAMEDVGATIEELLHIPVSDIFVKSWKDTDAIKDLLAESRKSPHAVTNVELADHTIKSTHRPHIEVRQKKETSKKIEFTLKLLFKLHGFSVRIQNGDIREIRTGPCEMQGKLEYQGLAVVEQKNGPIKLPQVIGFNEGQKVEIKEPAPVKIATPPATDLQPPVKPRSIEAAAPPAAVEPKVRGAAAAAVQSSSDSSSLIPPRKIARQEAETVASQKVSDPPPDVAPTPPAELETRVVAVEEEEEREVFVL